MTDGITEDAVLELLRIIVSIPSINPAFRMPGDDPASFGEAALARALGDWLEANGIAAELDEVTAGRPNLVARIAGRSGGPAMLWEGHLDTVQVTGMEAPFVPRLENGRLHGRGAVDDGGCVAAFLLALRALSRDPPPGDVEFCAAMDEEYAYKGVLHHLDRGGSFALGVAGEPTELQVVRACKGCVRWEVTLEGRSAHTARPEEGMSALDAGRRLLDLYDAEMATRTGTHSLLGPATLVTTGFEAGEGPNTVPSRARLRFDYRYLPSETGAEVYKAFRAVAEGLAGALPGIAVTVGAPFVDSSAMDVPDVASVVSRMAAICRERGLPDAAIGVPFGSDATKMVNLSAIPTIVFGPGRIEEAHSIDEFVEVADVVLAARMLVDLARATG
ncbi:acetylornithine deacetylase [Palleronia aestuarii]|uniref:Acetylornithine deacetylase n=1 Tax=Palleronia aestuarii TaxID=568105 RepID=A0A2W7NIA4_9RHOB|nr:M20/M25/M40 family metallo-hydrolase [Palleronia aestuarii]PZX12886.1 acetylornithine deacetylase [Palleronia aestuarii]